MGLVTKLSAPTKPVAAQVTPGATVAPCAWVVGLLAVTATDAGSTMRVPFTQATGLLALVMPEQRIA